MPRRLESSPYALKIGERIRELRLERNMSLADLADAAGLAKGHLSSVEHGFASITIQTISRLAKALELPSMYVLAVPTDSECDQVVELVRKLPAADVVKLRRELTKAVKDAAKEAAKAARVKT